MPDPKTGHVIEEYSVSKNTIVCVCSWKGDADDEWAKHKLEMKKSKNFLSKSDSTPFRDAIRNGIKARKVKTN